MLEALIESIILVILVLWFMKSIVDALHFRKIDKLHKEGTLPDSMYSYGMEVDMKTGESKGTRVPNY